MLGCKLAPHFANFEVLFSDFDYYQKAKAKLNFRIPQFHSKMRILFINHLLGNFVVFLFQEKFENKSFVPFSSR